MTQTSDERNESIIFLYKAGKCSTEIAALYSVSRQRVQQVLHKAGVGRYDGGQWKLIRERDAYNENARMMALSVPHACKLFEVDLVREQAGVIALDRYRRQKRHAVVRGIAWEISLLEWWIIWRDSGKWTARGRSKESFCMARHGDIGAYKKGNVFIQSHAGNCRDARMRTIAKKKVVVG